jgi:hypothetical protein
MACISREMSEQPSCPALILSDDEDDETEEGQQQQESGEDREQEACNSDTSSNGDVDNDDNHLQDNDESEGLQLTVGITSIVESYRSYELLRIPSSPTELFL